jgi:putative two-component system response regulator
VSTELAPPLDASHDGLDRSVILVVDDERGPRESLRMILEPSHEVVCARDGTEALEILHGAPVDLVTLDLNMPGVQGEELMRTIRREFPQVEVIVITGYGTLENAAEAVRYGVSDYLQKPFDVVQVSASVARSLARRRGRLRLASFLRSLGQVVGLDAQVQKVLDEAERDTRVRSFVGDLLDDFTPEDDTGTPLRIRTLSFLEVLADTVESQCDFMRGHARRTAFFAGLLAERLGLPSEQQQNVRMAAFLHDIGKIGVPTELLLRPSALDPTERRAVERHPEIGARLVEPLGLASDITAAIRHHHEWWDGRGYGGGLHGEQIPLSARIVAVADVYDAMSCDRPYRAALAPELVRQQLDHYGGVQFDPLLAKEFLLILESSAVDVEALVGLVESSGAAARAVRPLMRRRPSAASRL